MNLKALVKFYPAVQENDLINIVKNLSKDEQDYTRMYLLDDTIALAQVLPPAKQQAILLPYLKGLAEDLSWRIKYCVCDKLPDIASVFGKDTTRKVLLPYFVKYLQNSEPEVTIR